jgi:hypothetical protein
MCGLAVCPSQWRTAMSRIRMQLFALACAVLLVTPAAVTRTHAQQAAMPQDSFLLTVFLKHDQSKTLDQINEQLKHQDHYKKFPPPGVEIVSWYVMMGIGQVVTLRVPANRLRDVNRAIEQSAWGAYRTEFYPTYDFKPVAEEQRKTQ